MPRKLYPSDQRISLQRHRKALTAARVLFLLLGFVFGQLTAYAMVLLAMKRH